MQYKLAKKTWQILIFRQIRQNFFPSKVFYCTVEVSESDINDGALISYDEDIPTTIGIGSGSHVFQGSLTLCCIFGNCSCPLLYTALANLTSNTLINVTTNVQLPSIISLADLVNITITGPQQSHCEM